jgi:hypothetical protein
MITWVTDDGAIFIGRDATDDGVLVGRKEIHPLIAALATLAGTVMIERIGDEG